MVNKPKIKIHKTAVSAKLILECAQNTATISKIFSDYIFYIKLKLLS